MMTLCGVLMGFCMLHLHSFAADGVLSPDPLAGEVMSHAQVQRWYASRAPPSVAPSSPLTPKDPSPSPMANAFVTLLCDDTMITSTAVLVKSVVEKSRYPFIIIILPEVSQESREILRAVGGTLIEKSQLHYPWKASTMAKITNKPCRYSKLHAWSFIEYDKLVFLDADMLVIAPIDELFEYDPLSASLDIYPKTFNSGVLVIKPDMNVFQMLVDKYERTESYNKGDQGFLNTIFGKEWYAHPERLLPETYNYLVKYHHTSFHELFSERPKILHFTSETKPWNFYKFFHKDWTKNYHPELYWQWMDTTRSVQKQLVESSLATTWPYYGDERSYKRSRSLCEEYLHRGPIKKRTMDLYTVAINTYNRSSFLEKLVETYGASPFIKEIVIIWHDPLSPIPKLHFKNRTPVRWVSNTWDSLNNRFNPLWDIKTQAVMTCDDDIFITSQEVDFMFSVWKQNPGSLVGPYARFHTYNSTTQRYDYHVADPERQRYSMILTKVMFLHVDYLWDYTCLLPLSVHSFVDRHLNCEDVALNYLVAGKTQSPPMAIDVLTEDYGTTSGISSKSTHLTSRSECINFMNSIWNNDTLITSSVVHKPFYPVKFKKVFV